MAASKTQKETAGKGKKPCQETSKSPTPANQIAKAKVDSKAKEPAKKKDKSAASNTPEDDVWGQLAAASKKK